MELRLIFAWPHVSREAPGWDSQSDGDDDDGGGGGDGDDSSTLLDKWSLSARDWEPCCTASSPPALEYTHAGSGLGSLQCVCLTMWLLSQEPDLRHQSQARGRSRANQSAPPDLPARRSCTWSTLGHFCRRGCLFEEAGRREREAKRLVSCSLDSNEREGDGAPARRRPIPGVTRRLLSSLLPGSSRPPFTFRVFLLAGLRNIRWGFISSLAGACWVQRRLRRWLRHSGSFITKDAEGNKSCLWSRVLHISCWKCQQSKQSGQQDLPHCCPAVTQLFSTPSACCGKPFIFTAAADLAADGGRTG